MPDNLTMDEWQQFFELMGKITDLPMSVSEKTALVWEKAKECGERASMDFEEFTSWNFD